VSLFEFFVTAPAWASSAAGEHQVPSVDEIWFPLANFIIFGFIIARYALPVVRGFVQTRREEVLATIEESSAKKRRAESLVQDYKSRLMVLDKEVLAIETSLRDEGEREKTKILIEAQTLAARIKKDARFLADQEVKMARQKVREEMASLAEATARGLIERNLTAADQGRLTEDFIENIGQAR
jgi:F-type H+-transporting ATPase subunit b